MSERDEIQVVAVQIKTRTKLKVCETNLDFGKVLVNFCKFCQYQVDKPDSSFPSQRKIPLLTQNDGQVGIQRTEEAVCNSVGEAAGLFFQNIGQVALSFFWILACLGFLPPRSVLTGASPSANQFLGGFLVQAQVFGELLQWRKNPSFSKITIAGVRGGKHWQF